MNKDYEKGLKVLQGCSCKSSFSGTNVLVSCKVLLEPSPSLELCITDIKGNLWKLLITYSDFETHVEKLGFLNSDWENFFTLMREGFDNSLISGEIDGDVSLHIDYPIGEAKIRGSFVIPQIKNPQPQKIADLVFDYIQKLENRSLKRMREASPEIKSQVVEVPKIKPKPQKKKKPKQIGSKII